MVKLLKFVQSVAVFAATWVTLWTCLPPEVQAAVIAFAQAVAGRL